MEGACPRCASIAEDNEKTLMQSGRVEKKIYQDVGKSARVVVEKNLKNEGCVRAIKF